MRFSRSATASLLVLALPFLTIAQEVSCPADDNVLATAPSGAQFRVYCDVDFAGGDIALADVDTPAACMAACDGNRRCMDATLTSEACYLKDRLGSERPAQGMVSIVKVADGQGFPVDLSPDKPTTTGAVGLPEPSAIMCPRGNGTVYTTETGFEFLVLCENDHPGGDFAREKIETLEDCVELCDQEVDCVAVSLSGTACYLKNRLTAAVYAEGIWSARLLGSSSPSSNPPPIKNRPAYLRCPASDGQEYIARNGKNFTVECYTDYTDGDLFDFEVQNDDSDLWLEQCITFCSGNALCVAAVLSDRTCYLKSSLGEEVSNYGLQGARLASISPPQIDGNSSSSTTDVAAPTIPFPSVASSSWTTLTSSEEPSFSILPWPPFPTGFPGATSGSPVGVPTPGPYPNTTESSSLTIILNTPPIIETSVPPVTETPSELPLPTEEPISVPPVPLPSPISTDVVEIGGPPASESPVGDGNASDAPPEVISIPVESGPPIEGPIFAPPFSPTKAAPEVTSLRTESSDFTQTPIELPTVIVTPVPLPYPIDVEFPDDSEAPSGEDTSAPIESGPEELPTIIVTPVPLPSPIGTEIPGGETPSGTPVPLPSPIDVEFPDESETPSGTPVPLPSPIDVEFPDESETPSGTPIPLPSPIDVEFPDESEPPADTPIPLPSPISVETPSAAAEAGASAGIEVGPIALSDRPAQLQRRQLNDNAPGPNEAATQSAGPNVVMTQNELATATTVVVETVTAEVERVTVTVQETQRVTVTSQEASTEVEFVTATTTPVAVTATAVVTS